ncbi:ABC transporter ATP-binding protein [Chondrinema litorale]|uniref:ABC transporter ATP-binding protein n=1 Tax=Chondrinema litorale TaxID=2994555 RepID=UPI002543195B|nr:ABC transporter ATP-binding protein [Chondrinema litorale]UZR94113.1 ABC transporter ATP-binding protein [Chondrinema litorale]
MIEVRNLTKLYNGKAAVNNISFKVEKGEMFVLLGTSGCGKTTTLKMLNRLVEPDEGTILINGENIKSLQVEQLRRKTGYVIQQTGLFPHYTVEENIKVVPEMLAWKAEKMEQKVDELMDLLKLPSEMKKQYPDELSGGQRQRVGLARALAADPPLILLDEPFGALDPVTRQHLQDEFAQLENLLTKTMVMVTHDVGEAVKLADRICLMSEGEIVQMGTAKELLFSPVNDFVKSFFDSQRFFLEMSVIELADLADIFPENLQISGGNPLKFISANIDLLQFLESHTEKDKTQFAVKNSNGHILYSASRAEILEAYYQKYK